MLAPKSNGNTLAQCAPRSASCVQGVLTWGRDISLWVGHACSILVSACDVKTCGPQPTVHRPSRRTQHSLKYCRLLPAALPLSVIYGIYSREEHNSSGTALEIEQLTFSQPRDSTSRAFLPAKCTIHLMQPVKMRRFRIQGFGPTDRNTEHVPKNQSRPIPCHPTSRPIISHPSARQDRPRRTRTCIHGSLMQLGSCALCPHRASEGFSAPDRCMSQCPEVRVTSLGSSVPAPPSAPNLIAGITRAAGLDRTGYLLSC